MQWSILFATHKPFCSSYTHPVKCEPHFFPYAPLWFTSPNSEIILCMAGIKPNFFVYSNVMIGSGMAPEETCVHVLLGHSTYMQTCPLALGWSKSKSASMQTGHAA